MPYIMIEDMDLTEWKPLPYPVYKSYWLQNTNIDLTKFSFEKPVLNNIFFYIYNEIKLPSLAPIDEPYIIKDCTFDEFCEIELNSSTKLDNCYIDGTRIYLKKHNLTFKNCFFWDDNEIQSDGQSIVNFINCEKIHSFGFDTKLKEIYFKNCNMDENFLDLSFLEITSKNKEKLLDMLSNFKELLDVCTEIFVLPKFTHSNLIKDEIKEFEELMKKKKILNYWPEE